MVKMEHEIFLDLPIGFEGLEDGNDAEGVIPQRRGKTVA